MANSIFGALGRLLGSALVFAALSAPAKAQPVLYEFNALSSFDSQGEMFSGGFSVLSPGFIVSNTTFEPPALISCTVLVTPAAAATCRKQEFLLDVVAGNATVSFGVMTDANPGTGIYYYFEETAFSTPGFYQTVLFGTEQAGTLRVSAVPEPGTSALMALGLAGIGAWARRRRAAPAQR